MENDALHICSIGCGLESNPSYYRKNSALIHCAFALLGGLTFRGFNYLNDMFKSKTKSVFVLLYVFIYLNVSCLVRFLCNTCKNWVLQQICWMIFEEKEIINVWLDDLESN